MHESRKASADLQKASCKPVCTSVSRKSGTRRMTYRVRVIPSEHEFLVHGCETILESALRSGIAFNYGCSNGNCGMCQAMLISGETECVRHYDYVIRGADKAMNCLLLCSHTAKSDLIVEAQEAQSNEDIPYQDIIGRLKRKQTIADDIVLLGIQTPRTKRLRFLAGQRAKLTISSGLTREYPIASCPCDDRNLEFHVPIAASDAFTGHVLSALKPRDEINLRGPVGDFRLQVDRRRPIVFVACDIGFAAIKSLIEHAINVDWQDRMVLCWIDCGEGGHYMHNLARSWAGSLDNFEYVPLTVTQPEGRDDRSGQVQAALCDLESVFGQGVDQNQAVSNSDIYVAGPPRSIAGVQQFCLSKGVNPARLHVQAVP